jgi:hypothetical protein
MTREQAAAFTGHLYRLQRAAMDPTPPLAGKEGGRAKTPQDKPNAQR